MLNGMLILDKPAGITSHDAVALVRRVLGERSVGHLGTLDPMATGVLPLLLGKWTRLAQFFSAADKTYTGTIRFGYATDTFDAEGKPTGDKQPLRRTLEELRRLSGRFRGTVYQVPPAFSAKKIGGTPAYKLARLGKAPAMKAASITIHDFNLLGLEDDTASFSLGVSAGGYVRSIAHELGEMAGCGAHLSSLRRTSAGAFSLAEASTREQLIARGGHAAGTGLLVHPRAVLPEMPSVVATEAALTRLRNGIATNLPDFSGSAMVKVFTPEGELATIGKRIAGTLIHPQVNLL